MGMGIVSDSDFNSEFTKLTGQPIKKEVPPTRETEDKGAIIDIPRGRGEGSTEVPNSLRNLIGIESQTNGRQSGVELAQSLGISASSVSAYNVGATSTRSYDERPNGGVIRKTKDKIAKRARGKLMMALSKITEEKLDNANLKDISMVARDMSTIVKNMEPPEESSHKNNQGPNGPTFVFYSPQIRHEDSFNVVQGRD